MLHSLYTVPAWFSCLTQQHARSCAARTLDQLHGFCRDNGLSRLKILPFFSMVDARKSLHRVLVEHPPAAMEGGLHAMIPYASEVEQMGTRRAPVEVFAHSSRAGEAYRALWEALKGRLV